MDVNGDDARTKELDNMLAENAADIENRRRSLYEERISIEKSQGMGNWEPMNINPTPAYGSKKRK